MDRKPRSGPDTSNHIPLKEALDRLSLKRCFQDIHDIPEEGYIERRDDGTVVVLVKGCSTDITHFPGVTCLNPNYQHPEGRIYVKIFTQKRVFLPDEYKKAMQFLRGQKNIFVMSMNGYTRITKENLRDWGLTNGEYERACYDLVSKIIIGLRQRFSGVVVKLIDGGSNLGIDQALLKAEKDLNVESLSFSCPAWMMYVPDDKGAVYVGNDSNEYADRYIQSLDFLLSTGGREQALKHDIYCAALHGRRINFVDVAGAMSRTGGVPATKIDRRGVRKIENAAAVMGELITFSQAGGSSLRMTSSSTEAWEQITDDARTKAIEACAPLMIPETRFPNRI